MRNRLLNTRTTLLSVTIAVLLASVACGGTEEIIKEVTVEKIVEKEVVREVPVERVVEKEVIKEVPVQKVVIQEVEVERKKSDPRIGKLILATGRSIADPDPHIFGLEGSGTIGLPMKEGLSVDLGWRDFGPALAESWTMASDQLTWTYDLRRDVTFHSGDSLTAEDVVWSALRQRGMPKGRSNQTVLYNAEIRVLDPYTVQAVTKNPDPQNIDHTAGWTILSKAQADRDGDRFFEKFIYTGPYKFGQWVPGTKFAYEKNVDWWGEFAVGAPTVVEHNTIPEVSTQIAALLSGGVDVLYQIAKEAADLIDNSEDHRSIQRPSVGAAAICIAHNRAPFDNPKLREALKYAIDRDTIVNDIVGSGGPAAAWGSSENKYVPDDLRPYPFDPDKAKQLIKESGYDGSQFSLMTRVNRVPKDVETLQFVVATFNQLGLNAVLETPADAAFSERRSTADWQLYYSWHSTYNPSWFFNDLIIGHNVGYHETHPEYAKLAADMAMEMDPVKQVEKVHMLQRMLYEDQACLPTFYYDSIWGVSNRVEHLQNIPGWEHLRLHQTVMAPSAR